MKQLSVIKIGGNVIDNEVALDAFLSDFAQIKLPAILIHGGGKIATRIGDKLGIVSQYVEGRRITDDETIDLVTMVYAGLVNKKIVAALQAKGSNAIGLTGADGNTIPATKRPLKAHPSGDGMIDYGWVGDVKNEQVQTPVVCALIEAGVSPVFAPLTHDGAGHILNTNADTVASVLAVALSKHYEVRLIYCFEKKGVLENVDDENSVITLIDPAKYQQLKGEKKLFAGIIPKIDNAFDAIRAGVKDVVIGDAKDLLTNITEQTTGTTITG
jgi:acetylglutamate kinase